MKINGEKNERSKSLFAAWVALAATIFLHSGCVTQKPKTEPPPNARFNAVRVIVEPEEEIVKVGKTAKFKATVVESLKATKSYHFQWEFSPDSSNYIVLPGANKSTLVITDVTSAYVGMYRVVVKTASGTLTSEPASLSVYWTPKPLSVGSGTLTCPIGAFTSGSMAVCGGSFDKYKVFMAFDGPSVTSPSPTYPNSTNERNLTISTDLSDNATGLDTAIEFRKNVIPYSPVSCASDIGPTNLRSKGTIAMENAITYRVGIYYKSNTLGGKANVTFTWNYCGTTVNCP